MLSISFAGFKQYYNPSFTITATGDFDAGTVQLSKEPIQLSGVTLLSKKPMFEQKIDRMVINVKGSITSAGGLALESAGKISRCCGQPPSNAIALNGKDGVVVMINGKISRMPMDAVVQMLGGMNASNIYCIDIV